MSLSKLDDADFVQNAMNQLEACEAQIANLTRQAAGHYYRLSVFCADNRDRLALVFDVAAQDELATRLAVINKAVDGLFATGLMNQTRDEVEEALAKSPFMPL